MKKIAILCGLVAALLCLAQRANAQYVQIHRDGAGFVDNRGMHLSNQEIRDLVGEDVYFDTVVGAQKQYRIGRNLIRGGAITAGAGLVSALTGVALIAANSEDRLVVHNDPQYYGYRERVYTDEDEFATATGALFLVGGYLAMFTGATLLEVGIPLKIIGQSRLNWVENDYNDYSRNVSLHVGAAPNGVGLTLKF